MNVEVRLAQVAGFCYGVRRALDIVLEARNRHGPPMYTLGPLIHNPQVIERLMQQGILIAEQVSSVPEGSTIIIPSHGAPKDVLEEAEARRLHIIDATCPFVRKVQEIAKELANEGYQVVVLGDPGHTEVRGIMSVAGQNALAVSKPSELNLSMLSDRVGIVSQTTQTVEQYEELVALISAHARTVRAHNTICHATARLQKAALTLAADVDLMIVVGGRNSANTRRLAEICTRAGVPTYHIEVADEIVGSWFEGAKTVGVTAGASTPDWIIEEVIQRIKQACKKDGMS